jgi:hypothetical protein
MNQTTGSQSPDGVRVSVSVEAKQLPSEDLDWTTRRANKGSWEKKA